MGTSIAHLPADLRKRLNSELSPGEHVLYAAQPDWRGERGQMILIFFFGVFWSMIALTFFGVSISALLGYMPVKDSGSPPSLPLMWFFFFFSLPFVAIGLGLLAAPFLGIRKSKNTVHAITDARLINVFGARMQASKLTSSMLSISSAVAISRAAAEIYRSAMASAKIPTATPVR